MIYLGEGELKEFIFNIQHRILLFDNLADTLVASPAFFAALKSGIPALKNVVEEGLNKCRETFKQGEVAFSRAVQQLLSSKRNLSKVPDVL
jgi:hypothetical protein